MESLATVIYDKFFMRDLLGKFTPGLIVLYALQIDPNRLFPDETDWLWIYWVAAIPICLLTGLTLQIVGELIGLHSSSPYPKRILFGRWVSNDWQQANKQAGNRMIVFQRAAPEKIGTNARGQYERLVSLKEGAGNLGLAMIVVLAAYMSGFPNPHKSVVIALFLVTLILLLCHKLHAIRQANFMIGVLRQPGLLEDEQAEVRDIGTNIDERLLDTAPLTITITTVFAVIMIVFLRLIG